MKDVVSVITSFYNDENYILACINSINNQLINDQFLIEYILVNDCSTDSTVDIIKLYFNEHTNNNINVRIINTPKNLGPGGAKKLGISKASGNYFMFLDADDYYLRNDFILRAYSIITNKNADIVEFGYTMVNDNGEHQDHFVKDLLLIENNKELNMHAMFYKAYIGFMPWTKIIKRNIVESKEYDLDRQFDDIRTIPYWVYNANKIIIVNSIEINYRNKLDSIIRKNSNETRLGVITSICSLFEYFKNNKNIIKSMYDRCLPDLRTIIDYDSDDEYFREMSKINTKMLSYIYPNNYKDITYDVE